MRQRLATTLALATAAAVSLIPGGQAAPKEQPAPSGEYVPFVTDFPKRAAAPVREDDAPVTPATRSPAPDASGAEINWGSVGIAGGAGAALALLLASSRVVLRRRERPAPC